MSVQTYFVVIQICQEECFIFQRFHSTDDTNKREENETYN